jgi:cytoskeletal protein RodZ
MEVIGEKLKTSREEKGLSLNEVSEDLNIDMKELEELESGNKDAFSDIFVLKKYIYEYAKYLGLDYEKLIEDFNEFVFECTSKIPTDVIERISKQKEKEEAKEEAKSPYTIIPKDNKKKKIIIIALIVLVLIIVAVVAIKAKNNSTDDMIAMASLK